MSRPAKLAYSSFKPSSGADEHLNPVIFMHGLTRSKECWSSIPQKVADATKRMVYTVDARNHGDSEWNDHFDFDVNAKDLLPFMDKLNIKKAVVVGHSMGGMTGIRVALAQPDRVEKLIIEDMFVRKVPKPLADIVFGAILIYKKVIQEINSELDEDAAKRKISELFYQQLPPEIKNLIKPSKSGSDNYAIKRNVDGRWVFKSNMDALEKVVREADNNPEPQGVYKGPALFIYGGLSPFAVKSDEDHIKQHFPNAEFTCIEEATHSVHIELPEEFTEKVLKFLL